MNGLCLLALFLGTAMAQQTTPVATPQPNCLLNISLQTAGQNSPVLDNRQVGCLNFTVAVAVPTTVSALQLVVQTAQDNGSTLCSTCTWATFTAATGSNPNTSTAGWTSTFVTATSVYYGYLRVQLVSITGTGSITGKLFSFLAGATGGGGGGGGGGTVTQVNTACGIGGGPITAAGTVTRTPIVTKQAAASYAIQSTDCGNVVELTNTTPTPTIAQAGTAGFTANWITDLFCAGSGGCTLTPAVSTINGAASIAWAQNQTIRIISDGANYQALFVVPAGASGGGVIQNGTPWSCVDASGSTTTYTCNLTPALAAYAVNMFVDFIPQTTNTGASTLNINGLGTRAIEKIATPSGVGAGTLVALTANDLIGGTPYTLRAFGSPVSAWILQQPYTQVSINTVANAGGCTDTSGSANTITCTTVVGFNAYAAKQSVDLILANTVTGATTININGLGAKAVTYNGTTTMASGIMVAGGTYRLEYDGTEFVLQGSVGAAAATGGGITVYSGATALAATLYFPIGGGSLPSATEAQAGTFSPTASTVSNFYVNLSAAPGLGNSIVFTWRDATVSQTLTCTISGAVATSCSDLTHTFTTVAGDKIDIQAVTTGTIAGTPVLIMSASFGGGGGGGGGGSTTTLGPIASLPGSVPAAGNTYQTTDSWYRFVSDGAVWQPFVGNVSMTLPPTAGWTFDNQAGTTVSTAKDALFFLNTGGIATGTLVGYTRTIAATPYTYHVCFYDGTSGGGANAGIGIGVSDGTKYVTWETIHASGSNFFDLITWTSSTGGPTAAPFTTGGPYFMAQTPMCVAISDDGTNRKYSIAFDQINYVVLYSEANTTFLTATNIAFIMRGNGVGGGGSGGGPTAVQSATVVNWNVTASGTP